MIDDLIETYGLEWVDYVEYIKEENDMGWWSIVDRDSKYDMVNGDTPADIMGDAIEKIVKTYQAEWHRKPYRKEMQAVFKFTSSLPEYYTEVDDE